MASLEEIVVIDSIEECATDGQQPNSPLLPSNSNGPTLARGSSIDVVSTLEWFRNVFNTAATFDHTLSINEWRLALQYPVSFIMI